MSNSLTADIGAAMDAHEATPEATTTETPETAVEPGQPGMIGMPEVTQQEAFALAEGMAPEAIVATFDGKPLTAGELKDHLFRQSDYTRKTQTLAETLKALPEFNQWVLEHEQHLTSVAPFVQALARGDQQAAQAALVQIAEAQGIQLGRPRDERGRFTTQQQEENNDLDLEELVKEGYGPDSTEYKIAARNNALNAQLREQSTHTKGLESKLDQFLGQVETKQQEQQTAHELTAIGSEWSKLGLTVDLEGAAGIVGKTITPDMAMKLHHFEAIMRHNLSQANKAAPTTPARLGTQPTADFKGKSLAEAIGSNFR